MKKIIYTIPLLLILVATSCKKVKLEDDERGKLLLGKWKYQYSGYHISQLNFQKVYKPYKSFTIEFLEGGELCINDNGESTFYRIYNNNNIDNEFGTYALWHNRIGYGKEKDNTYFEIDYYSADSVKISYIPYQLNQSYGSTAGNIFDRVE